MNGSEHPIAFVDIFDSPPYEWQAHPIIDSNRWWGFDLFGAFQFLHLMQLMFFLSGLFVWSSLVRKGAATFLIDRVIRLGVPFAVGVILLMPLAYFPAYSVRSVDPSWSGFWSHWISLPFWPSGPTWFLWFILVLNVSTGGIYWLAPRSKQFMVHLSDFAGRYPERFFISLVAASALIYLPLARLFEPWQWIAFGPFAIQPSLAPQYAVYFLAGLTVGAGGIDRGFLGSDGMLAQRWVAWLVGAVAAFLLWVVPAALIEKGQLALPVLGIARELGVVLFAASACFASIAFFLRFATLLEYFRERLWHLSVPLCVCHLDAIFATPVSDTRHRKRSDCAVRYGCLELGRRRQCEQRSGRGPPDARRAAYIYGLGRSRRREDQSILNDEQWCRCVPLRR